MGEMTKCGAKQVLSWLDENDFTLFGLSDDHDAIRANV